MNTPTQYTGKYLTFNLGKEGYGISISKVKEIIGMMAITEMPQKQSYMKGVVNLRDKVIPIVDARQRLEMDQEEYTERTCIIIVEIDRGNSIMLVGLIVDSVSEVLMLEDEQIDKSTDLGSMLSLNYILGMAKVDDGIKILLDIDAVFDDSELEHMERLDRAA